MSKKIEFGDFQTPLEFSNIVIDLLKKIVKTVSLIIEPTCGLGNFIDSAKKEWNVPIEGYEINQEYFTSTKEKFSNIDNISIFLEDFFNFDWNKKLCNINEVLILGNPPWVTNSKLGQLNSTNLPDKSNFQKMRGLDAQTGKSNFDIAEWIIIELIKFLPVTGKLAMLCKTSTARKVLMHLWKKGPNIGNAMLFGFDAKRVFDVNVDACLFYLERTKVLEKEAKFYGSLDLNNYISKFGIVNGELISNIDDYSKYKNFDGFSNYTWRSGVKHDASKIMELNKDEGHYINGNNDIVNIEDDYVYPLLKSSDVGNNRVTPRKYVIVTQKKVGEDTGFLKYEAPKTWEYLEKNSNILDNRKSSIYKNKPKFSIFGIGEYSFSQWKVAISGMYKSLKFVAIPPVDKTPIMLDDTCYFFSCKTEDEANFWVELLNSEASINFLHSLVFFDAKRPITIDILKRIDLYQLAVFYKKGSVARKYLEKSTEKISDNQLQLVF